MAGNSRGARFEVSFNTLGIDAAMLNLSNRYDLLSNLAQKVQEQSKERFETQIDPDGQPWKPWSEVYAKTVTNSNASILRHSGALQQSIASEIFSPESAVVGTKLGYAKMHQYGGITDKGWTVPARPFLGISDENKAELQALAQHWIQEHV